MKMVTEEASKLPFSYWQDKYAATHGASPSERDPETNWPTPTNQEDEKPPTSSWIGKTETQSHHKPHYQKSAPELGENRGTWVA